MRETRRRGPAEATPPTRRGTRTGSSQIPARPGRRDRALLDCTIPRLTHAHCQTDLDWDAETVQRRTGRTFQRNTGVHLAGWGSNTGSRFPSETEGGSGGDVAAIAHIN